MPFSFGAGVSDFVAVGQLAWRIFEACKAAPEKFATVSTEVESLHCVLEEAGDTQMSQPLSPRRQARLDTILKGCVSVLGDLQFIVHKYQSLGTDEKRAWDRLKMGTEDINEIRSRLVVNIMLLTAFRSMVVGSPMPHRPSVCDSDREYGSWQWVVELSGSDSMSPPKRLPGPGGSPSFTEYSESEGFPSPRMSVAPSIAPSISDRSFTKSEADAPTLVEVRSLTQSPPLKAKSKPRFFSRKHPLIAAVDGKNLHKALDALQKELIDQETLDHALWAASRFPSSPLMEALVARGASVDAVYDKTTVLREAVSANNEDAVRFLFSKKVNANSEHLSPNALPLRAALRSDSMMSLLAKSGTPLDTEYQVSTVLRLNILQEAVHQGRESIVRILLNAGAKVDASSTTHGTALMLALSMGRKSIAKLLVQKGANVNYIRHASAASSYTNPVEAAIRGRNPDLLRLVFQAGAIVDAPQALRFAQANSDYPLLPNSGSQYGNDNDGTRRFYEIMVMLAQRDLKYVCFFRKDDEMRVKREGIRRMMIEVGK